MFTTDISAGEQLKKMESEKELEAQVSLYRSPDINKSS